MGKQARKEKKEKEGDAEAPAKLTQVHLSRLSQLIKPELRPLSISVGTLGITTGISLIFPYAIGQILDVALKPDAFYTPTTLSLALLALFGVQSAMIVLRSALLSVAGERMAANVRKDLFRAVMAQDCAWFDRHRTGDIINRLSADTVVVQKALTANVANGLRSAAMVVGGAGMLFYLSPALALLSLGLIPPVALGGMQYGRYLQGQQKAVQAALGRTMEVAEEMVGNVKTVRAFAAEGRAAARFAERVNDAYVEARRIGIVAAGFDGVVHLAANISLVAVLGYGGHLVSAGTMTAGDLTAFLMYSLYTGFNVSNLSTVYSELKRAAGAAGRIFDIVDRAPDMPLASDPQFWLPAHARASVTASAAEPGVVHSPDDAPVVPSDGSMLLRRRPTPLTGAALAAVCGPTSLERLTAVRGHVAFEGVTFAYPTRAENPVLRSFDLDVSSGTSLCLVGSSGSGKSTVGALLCRLYDPQAGRVTLDGHALTSLDPTWLRSNIAVVSQEPVLFAASIADNIRFGRPDATDAEVEEAARVANIHTRITGFPRGYGTLVGEKGQQLSGGERARVAVARAILKRSPITIHDESTAALDAQSEGALLAALRELSAGRTTITIAHRLSTIKHSQVVAVLEGGRVAELGSFDDLSARDPATSPFRQLVERQAVALS
jgi:ATP-binding cassette subfamily B protein